MNHNITETLMPFPDFLSTDDLVKLGIYKSIDATYQARLKKHGPEYIKLRKKILYPKLGLISFLTGKSNHEGVENGK